MKTLLTLLLSIAVSNAAVVTGLVQQITANWSTNTRIVFSNMSTPLINGGPIVTSIPKFSTTASNGWFSNSLVFGYYKVWIGDSPRDYVNISVPDSSLTYDVWTLRTNSITTTSNSVSIVRGVAPGSGVSTSTNNGVVTVSASGSGEVTTAQLNTASNALSSAIMAATNSSSVTNWINQRQPASTVLSNISGLAGAYTISANEWAMNLDNAGVGGINFTMDAYGITLSLTNRGGSAAGIRYVGTSNGVPWDFWLEDLPGSIASRQGGSAVLTNLAGTGALTNSSQFVASSGGLATNLNIKAAAGASLALTINTNTLVVTNGRVGIGTNAPVAPLEVQGSIRASSGITNSAGVSLGNGGWTMDSSGNVVVSSGNSYSWSGHWGIGSGGSGEPNLYGNGFNDLIALHLGNRDATAVALVFSNTAPVAINFRDGLKTNSINASARSYLIETSTNTIAAPSGLFNTGAQLWSDGTNLCVVFQNTAGARTTNKLSFTSWP